MGSCLSCEGRRMSVPSYPIVAKKWKFSAMTSFACIREDEATLALRNPNIFLNLPSEIASLSGKKGMLVLEVVATCLMFTTPFSFFASFTTSLMILCNNELQKNGSKTKDTTDIIGLRTSGSRTGDATFRGPYGDMVAKRIRNFLPPKLSKHWEVTILSKTGSNSQTSRDVVKVVKVKETNLGCVCSGRTSLTLVKKGQDLTIGNIGDSRAVLGMRGANKAFVPVQMSVEQDEFVVLSTAGIWDELWNGDVHSIVAASPTRLCAARALVDAAIGAWKQKYKFSKVDADDCEVVCLFLDSPLESDMAEMRRKKRRHHCSYPEQFVERIWAVKI
ncbi:putative protein phosphatase 2C 74 [Salvia divinorum]|uniref:PPM-type phosphatase domain-containing protein n=1 Tax=Salvia divinorum TaxID=28513 RepID=A0ABD1G0S1_SALDI